jgi:hypothetical protein
LRATAQDEPLLIVIEDLHWIDALSHDLLEELARALADSPICFVLAYRPPQLARLEAPRLEALPNFTRIELTELNASEAEQAIRAKLRSCIPRGATQCQPCWYKDSWGAPKAIRFSWKNCSTSCATADSIRATRMPGKDRAARQSAHAHPQPH